MIKDLKKLTRGGLYIADYRMDEGIRIREDNISPCMMSRHDGRHIANSILIIEVTEK